MTTLDPPGEFDLPIIFRDDDYVVVDKPSGLAMHRGWARERHTVLSCLRDRLNQHVFLPHRLDRATSGVVIVALSSEAAAAAGEAFAARRAEKRYLALVRGIAPETDVIDYSLRKGEERGPHVPRQDAMTEVRRLGVFERYSLVEARPRTGRLHQIRRHLKHRSLHVIGDTRYGKGEHNRLFRERFGLHRLALHAGRLDLPHPLTGEPWRLLAEPRGTLRDVLAATGLLPAALHGLNG